MSLRTRLLLGLLAAVLTGLLVVDILTYTLVARSQLDQVDQDLERAHPPIERAASASGAERERSIRDAAPGFFVELRDADGSRVVTIPLSRPGDDPMSLRDADLPAPTGVATDDEATFVSVSTSDDHQMRLRISRQSNDQVLVIGRSLETTDETLGRLLVVLLLATGGALVVAGAVGLTLVRIGLRPLVAVERAAARITDTELDRRVPVGDGRTEVGRLATAINRMLDRLHGAFEQRADDLTALQESESRMRRFVADASHELRTPIAATAAYAELFERGARDRPADLERAMSGIRAETARMADLVEDLLLLAQLDEGRPLADDPVDLADVVVDAVDAAAVVAPDRPVALRIEDAPLITGDANRLRQVVDNLLANVRTHTPIGTHCQVVVASHDDAAVVTVTDDGPGIPPADARRAFDRFHRADPSRTRASGGAGLGLAIVDVIVAAHGGTVNLSSDIGVGTTVTIRLPLIEGSS